MTPEEREAWWGSRLTLTLVVLFAAVTGVALVAVGWALGRLGLLP